MIWGFCTWRFKMRGKLVFSQVLKIHPEVILQQFCNATVLLCASCNTMAAGGGFFLGFWHTKPMFFVCEEFGNFCLLQASCSKWFWDTKATNKLQIFCSLWKMQMDLNLLGATCDNWGSLVPKLKDLDMLRKGLFYAAKAIPGFHALKLMFVLQEEKRTRVPEGAVSSALRPSHQKCEHILLSIRCSALLHTFAPDSWLWCLRFY